MGPVERIRAMGFEVRQFSPYHFRVEEVFEFWLPRGKWHDMRTGERGQKPLDQIPFFVKRRLEDAEDSTPSQTSSTAATKE